MALLLLAACAPPDPCVADDRAEEGPFAACAAGCPTTEEAFDCCVSAHGYGVVHEGDLRRLEEGCEGEDCDPALYLSLDSAACLAHAERGLGAGLLGYSGTFFYSDGEAWWIVEIVTELECEPGEIGHASGEAVQVDARSGAVHGSARTDSVVECAE